jgi:hypothetical protein
VITLFAARAWSAGSCEKLSHSRKNSDGSMTVWQVVDCKTFHIYGYNPSTGEKSGESVYNIDGRTSEESSTSCISPDDKKGMYQAFGYTLTLSKDRRKLYWEQTVHDVTCSGGFFASLDAFVTISRTPQGTILFHRHAVTRLALGNEVKTTESDEESELDPF